MVGTTATTTNIPPPLPTLFSYSPGFAVDMQAVVFKPFPNATALAPAYNSHALPLLNRMVVVVLMLLLLMTMTTMVLVAKKTLLKQSVDNKMANSCLLSWLA